MQPPFVVLREALPGAVDPGLVEVLELDPLLDMYERAVAVMAAGLSRDDGAHREIEHVFAVALSPEHPGHAPAVAYAYLLRRALRKQLEARMAAWTAAPVVDAPPDGSIGSPDLAPGGISDPNDKSIGSPDIAPAQRSA